MEPSTQDLPFLLVYGPWIWKVGLGVLVALVFGLVFAWRRLAARRWIRGVQARIDERDSDGVIRGKLGGEAITVFARAPYADAQRASWRSDALWVETDDGRVNLEGEVVVQLGTAARATRYGLPEMPDALRERVNELPIVEQSRWSVMRLARVSSGDEVVVRGKLVRKAGNQEATFREAPVALTLTATPSGAIELAASAPKHVLPMISPFRATLLAGLTLFGGYKVASAIGEDLREDCWRSRRYEKTEGFVQLDSSDRCVRAAAMPGAERAVGELYLALEDHPHRDERSFARLAYLADKSDNCKAFLHVLDETGRLDDLLTYARRCKDPFREQDALYALGRYDEGVAVEGGAKPSLDILIAAERWEDAARSAAETALYFETQTNNDPRVHAMYASAARQKRCLEQMFLFHGGDALAAGRMAKLAASDPDRVCLPMMLEVVPPADRPKQLSELDIWHDRFDVKRAVRAQGLLDGLGRFETPFEGERPEATLVQLDELGTARSAKMPWLARLAPPSTDPEILRWQAVAKVLDGRPDDAARLASTVTAQQSDAMVLPSAIDLYTTSTEDKLGPWFAGGAYRSESFGRLILRAGRDATPFQFGYDLSYREALVAAQHGDGTALAKIITKEKWWTLGDVLAVWPRIEHGRDLVRARLVWNAQYGTWRTHSPFDLAASAAMRRDLFRMIGESSRAAYWDAVYQRVARVFDRKRMMAFLLAE